MTEFPSGGYTSPNVIRCKRTGQGIAMLLGGGPCACANVDDCEFIKEAEAGPMKATLGPSNEELNKRFRATVRLFDRLCHQWGVPRSDSQDAIGKRMWLRDHCAIVVASMPLEDLDDM